MSYGITRREELGIEVGAMCAEVERIEQVWRNTRHELHVDDGCLALSERLCSLRLELAALRRSLGG